MNDRPNTHQLVDLALRNAGQELGDASQGVYPTLIGDTGWQGISRAFVDEHRELIHAALDELPEEMQQAYDENGVPKLRTVRDMIRASLRDSLITKGLKEATHRESLIISVLMVLGFAVGRLIPVQPIFLLAVANTTSLLHLRPRDKAFSIPVLTEAEVEKLQRNTVRQQTHVYKELRKISDSRSDSHVNMSTWLRITTRCCPISGSGNRIRLPQNPPPTNPFKHLNERICCYDK